MTKKVLSILILPFITVNILSASLGPFTRIFKLDVDQIARENGFAEQVQKEIEGLEKKKTELEQSQAEYKSEYEKTQNQLDLLREKEKEEIPETEKEFRTKHLIILNQITQTLSEINQVYKQIINSINENIRILKEFKEDPEFKNKNLYLPPKSIYSIDDLQKANDLILQRDQKIRTIDDQLDKTQSDLENRKKTLSLANQELEEKKKEQKELKKKNSQEKDEQKLTIKQQAEILDLEEKLLQLKKDLAKLRVQETVQKIHLIETELRITKLQKEILEKEYDRIKQELRIEEKDLKQSEEILKNQIQESTKKQEEANKQLEALDASKLKIQNQINQLKENYNVSDADLEAIKDGSLQPNSIKSWAALIQIGQLFNQIKYEIEVNKETILANIDYEKAKITDKEIDNLIINSWYKLTTGKLETISYEELAKEIKQYEKAKVDIQARISATTDKKLNASTLLNNNNEITEHLKERLKELKDQKDTLFKGHLGEYNRYHTQLKNEIYEDIPKRGEIITQLIELYNTISNTRNLIIKKIDGMIDELKAKQQWIGAPFLWRGLASFLPDIKRFSKSIFQKNLCQILIDHKQSLFNFIGYYQNNPSEIFPLILKIILIIIIFALIKLYMEDIITMLNTIGPKHGIGYTVLNFLIHTLTFITSNISGIFIWFIFLLAVRYNIILDNNAGIIFYFISIPFWLILGFRYIKYLAKINRETNFSLISEEYQFRFFAVLTFFLYSTIIIIFFREAFLLANLPKSDVPTILLATNFIILQISLICILSKEQILKLIPQTTTLWQWIYEQIENYYYFFLAALIFIIVMSNPYIGYGPNFFYFISRIILILLLIPLFMFIHNRIKRFSTNLFIYSDTEVTKERFPYARTSYGIFVILSFLFFITLAIIIGANIWGYKIGLNEILEWLQYELYPFKDPDTGRTIYVTVTDIGRVLLYFAVGILSAYLINKYVLGRVFELLLVNIGIQNAIQSLVRYTVIIVAIIIGLKSIGMSSLLIYTLAIVGGLGVAGKEIIYDFLGYFIILIQRPIKIGDFIRLDDQVFGVVRHITLRSVFIRRKNSVTVIVPNSQIMARAVANWNYSRSYFAFDDILLTIPYSADPGFVKDLFVQILDSNLNILKNPAPIVLLNDFTDNGFQFLIRGYLSFDKVLDQWEIASQLRLELVRVLRENGISVASPTRILLMEKSKDDSKKSNLPL